ncbi:MAG: N-6 DNA methylase, partial [Prevotellaceae bacterium]|nr:N-6 DNA methylase [Prevotellaceae bacterium]
MPYSKKSHLQQNIEVIKHILLPLDVPQKELSLFKRYSGFGALKCVLLPAETEADKQHWVKSELDLFPLVQELHRTIRNGTGSEQEYKKYMDSIKNSVLTAFYTPTEIVKTIAASLSGAGIHAQTILDPSAGAGQFVADFKDAFPKSVITAYEKDIITGKILQQLYHNDSVRVNVSGFETTPPHNNNRFDIVTSNIPFGDISVPDTTFHLSKEPARQLAARHIHNYFFFKGIDILREGGILAFITSQGVADAPANKPIRKWLMNNSNLVSAVRLPNNLFVENAGTEVGSDLLILQKDTKKRVLSDNEKKFIATAHTKAGLGINEYIYKRENLIFTDTKTGTDMYGKLAVILTHSGGVTGIAQELQQRLTDDFSKRLNVELYQQNLPAPRAIVAHAQVQQPIQPQQSVQVKPPAQAKSSEPLQTLYDLFGLSPEERSQANQTKQKGAKKTLVNTAPEPPQAPQPERYIGKIAEYHKSGTLVKNDRSEVGVLSIDENSDFIFNPLIFNQRQVQESSKIAHYIDVRDAYYSLYATEQITQVENQAGRERLNRLYDEFVDRYGMLNNKANRPLVDMDANRKEILAIERQEDKNFVKSDIFNKPVAFSQNVIITTPEEALLVSLDQYNEVRIDYISHQLNISKDEVMAQLEGKIFYNPLCKANYEIAGKFLSGNIFEKIDTLTDFANKNGENEQLTKSIAALQNVIPDKIPFELLEFNYGERWLPIKIYEEFASYLFKTKTNVRYHAIADEFVIDPHTYTAEITEKYNVRTTSRYYNGVKLMQYALHNTTPNITKTIEVNGEEKKVRDTKAIQRVNAKIEEIRNEFTAWLNRQPQTVKDEICDLYNRKFNCFVKSTYDGTHQSMPGLSFEKFKYKSLYGSQKNAVWMLKQNGGGIIDHEVGGGKTMIMCCAGHEMKRLGLANRPMIIGLKANIQAIAETYCEAYPDAKILYPGKEDFTENNRADYIRKIKNNDWDCVILTHEQFAKIPQSLRVQKKILDEELNAAEESLQIAATEDGASKSQLRGLERRKASIETRLAVVNQKMSNGKDDVPDFEELGIDHIFVDESHQFKNLTFATRHNQVAGLGNPTGSGRALNLLYAIRSIQDRTGKDLGATFLSGTTISNSLTELYLIFKYLRPKALEAQSIHSFDAWAAVYA